MAVRFLNKNILTYIGFINKNAQKRNSTKILQI